MIESPQRCGWLMKLITSWAILAAVVAPTAVLLAGMLNRGFSLDSLVTAAVAGGVCWIAATLALAVTFLGNKNGAPIQGVLGGMLFRMGLPLAAVLALPQLDERLASSGLVGTILGVYLVTLAVETLLALKMVPSHAQSAKAA